MPSYAITGAARGLGFEWINNLSSNPANTVFALVRNTATATKLDTLSKSRKNVHILQSDVTKPDELIAAASAIGKVTGGSLDVLIHNATAVDMATMALPPSAFTPENAALTRQSFEVAMDTNVFGALWVTNAMLPLIEKGQGKKIVHITSGMADSDVIKKTEIAYGVAYAAAKAGMNILAAKYAAELKPKGIYVLSLSPGWVDTVEGPVPPKMQEWSNIVLSQFQKLEPDLKGPISSEDSVRMQLEVIERLDEKMSGSFVSHHGDQNWL